MVDMTLREYMGKQLEISGLWPNEAAEVMNFIIEEDARLGAAISTAKWSEESSGYAVPILATTLISVKQDALNWLRENKPNHFAIALLESELTVSED